jgi:hypothetical protein
VPSPIVTDLSSVEPLEYVAGCGAHEDDGVEPVPVEPVEPVDPVGPVSTDESAAAAASTDVEVLVGDGPC